MRRRPVVFRYLGLAAMIVAGLLTAIALGFVAADDQPARSLAKVLSATTNLYAFAAPPGWVDDSPPNSFPMASAIGEFAALESWTPPSSNGTSLVFGRRLLSISFDSDVDGIARMMRIAHPRFHVSKPVKLDQCDAKTTTYELAATFQTDTGASRSIQQVYTYAGFGDVVAVATLTFDPSKGPAPADGIASLKSLCPRIETTTDAWIEIIILFGLGSTIIGFTPILFKRVLTVELFREANTFTLSPPEAHRFVARIAFYWAAIILIGAAYLIFWTRFKSGGA